MDTPKKPTVSEFLARLGSTPDEVARTLQRLGVYGKRADPRKCPLAVAINEHSNGWGGIQVGNGGHLTYRDSQIMDPVAPEPVKQFAVRFDLGLYPFLDSSQDEVKSLLAARERLKAAEREAALRPL